MASPLLDEAVTARLRAELEAIDGVRRALIDGPPTTVYLVCEHGEAAGIEMQASAVLTRHGLDRRAADVQVSFLVSPQPARRVRFLRARMEHPAARRAVASVSVEWNGHVFERDAEGESGEALDLRLAALATLRTVEAVIEGALSFRLVGIKSMRAFDTDLVVVLLHTEHGQAPLIGASLARESPHQSAAIAVLNATNRVLGNYLATTD